MQPSTRCFQRSGSVVLFAIVWAAANLAATSKSSAGDEPLAFKNAKIHTVAGPAIDRGTLVVHQGKIVAVGPADQIRIPAQAKVIDAAGKVIMPGIVDTHSHLGVYSRPSVPANSDGNEMSGPVQGAVRALDAINPFDPGFRMALAGGVTTANVMPGSGNVIGGQTLYIKLRGHTVEQMWIPSHDVLGGLKMANGENPKRAYGGKGQAPQTRMKIAALQRTEFIKAREYLAKWDAYRKKLGTGAEATPPEVDLKLEPLAEALQKKRTVHFHSHRADDIMTVLRLAEEFDFELVVQHGTEAYKIADELAQRRVPVSMTVVDSPGGKAEVVNFLEECGAELTRRGVKVLVNSDDPVTECRFFLRTAAIPVRGGLPDAEALKTITLHPAQVMHLDQQLGTLEAGKDADFVVLSGEPFSVYSRVLATYIDGRQVFDLENPSDRLYQTGGFAVPDKQLVPKFPLIAPPQMPGQAPQPNERLPGAESRDLVVRAARLFRVSQPPLDDAAVWLRDGQVLRVGPWSKLESKLPKEVPIVSAAVATPGLIDAHSLVPLTGQYNISADQDADERTDPNQADLRVLDAFHPQEPLLQFLLEQGITVVHACPGRANVLAGSSGVFRTHGHTAEAMTIRFPQAVVVNLGEAPKSTYSGQRPDTRMGTASLIRQEFSAAAAYRRKRGESQASDKKETTPPDRNLKHEALSLALDQQVDTLFCAQRADDLGTALRLAKEFQLRPVLALACEGYLTAEELAKADVPIIAHPTMQRVGDMETYHSFLGNAATLADRGLRVAIGSGFESYVPKTRVVRHEAAIALVYGLGFERALKAITLDAARILRIDDRYGSIEPGKVGDLVLYDGDPFEHRTHVTHVVVAGRLVYHRASRPALSFEQRSALLLPDVPCCLGW